MPVRYSHEIALWARKYEIQAQSDYGNDSAKKPYSMPEQPECTENYSGKRKTYLHRNKATVRVFIDFESIHNI